MYYIGLCLMLVFYYHHHIFLHSSLLFVYLLFSTWWWSSFFPNPIELQKYALFLILTITDKYGYDSQSIQYLALTGDAAKNYSSHDLAACLMFISTFLISLFDCLPLTGFHNYCYWNVIFKHIIYICHTGNREIFLNLVCYFQHFFVKKHWYQEALKKHLFDLIICAVFVVSLPLFGLCRLQEHWCHIWRTLCIIIRHKLGSCEARKPHGFVYQ